ncbi:MAG: hypothetical protein AAF549_04000 [Pseudomonadota bacterium]
MSTETFWIKTPGQKKLVEVGQEAYKAFLNKRDLRSPGKDAIAAREFSPELKRELKTMAAPVRAVA